MSQSGWEARVMRFVKIVTQITERIYASITRIEAVACFDLQIPFLGDRSTGGGIDQLDWEQ